MTTITANKAELGELLHSCLQASGDEGSHMGVWIDENTPRLLDGSFNLAQAAEAFLLAARERGFVQSAQINPETTWLTPEVIEAGVKALHESCYDNQYMDVTAREAVLEVLAAVASAAKSRR